MVFCVNIDGIYWEKVKVAVNGVYYQEYLVTLLIIFASMLILMSKWSWKQYIQKIYLKYA